MTTELEETLDVQPKASLEQIDLALKSFVHLAARYYGQSESSPD